MLCWRLSRFRPESPIYRTHPRVDARYPHSRPDPYSTLRPLSTRLLMVLHNLLTLWSIWPTLPTPAILTLPRVYYSEHGRHRQQASSWEQYSNRTRGSIRKDIIEGNSKGPNNLSGSIMLINGYLSSSLVMTSLNTIKDKRDIQQGKTTLRTHYTYILTVIPANSFNYYCPFCPSFLTWLSCLRR